MRSMQYQLGVLGTISAFARTISALLCKCLTTLRSPKLSCYHMYHTA